MCFWVFESPDEVLVLVEYRAQELLTSRDKRGYNASLGPNACKTEMMTFNAVGQCPDHEPPTINETADKRQAIKGGLRCGRDWRSRAFIIEWWACRVRSRVNYMMVM